MNRVKNPTSAPTVPSHGTSKPSHLKPLRHPRLSLGLWWLAIVLSIAACLIPGRDLPQVPGGLDKVEHLLAFAVLAACAVQLFASRRALLIAALGLVALGIAIEVAQGALTNTRSMDPWDAVADALGVLLGMATVWTPWRDLLLQWDGRKRTR